MLIPWEYNKIHVVALGRPVPWLPTQPTGFILISQILFCKIRIFFILFLILATYLTCWDLLGCVRMHSDMFGGLRMHSDASGQISKIFELFGQKECKYQVDMKNENETEK